MLSTWLLLALACGGVYAQQPCVDIHSDLRLPCRCRLDASTQAIHMNCDRVVFAGNLPAFPYRAPIVSFSHKYAGHQALPTQAFTSANLPLKKIDFSGNLLRRLTDRLFQGLHPTLEVLLLSDNLLGDNLNPIFSSSEFHGLYQLRVLDLSGNMINGIEEGLLKGCSNLKELWLARNSITAVPTASINGPKALRLISLKDNRIATVAVGAFQAQKSLEAIDLSYNLLTSLEGGSLSGLSRMRTLLLKHNRFTRFNSDVFQGAENLDTLDISENFISEFPTLALKSFLSLKHLNLSSNLIQSLENSYLISQSSLESLDLSRNSITSIAPGSFLGLRKLRHLDLSINSLRTVEEDMFDGLDNLETLSLGDNNILLVPATALARMPHLVSVQLGFNRIAALSGQLLRAVSSQITVLNLERNVVRELPANTFVEFNNLRILNLGGNLLASITAATFNGLESNLLELCLSRNRLTSLTGLPIKFSKLNLLDLSRNQIAEISANGFTNVQALTSLNLSHNTLNSLPSKLFHQLPNLKTLDLSFTTLKVLAPELLSKNIQLEVVNLQGNLLQEVPEGSFNNLQNLTRVDLSMNQILNIRPGAFIGTISLLKVLINNNRLGAFKGEIFKVNTGSTAVEEIDLSNNELSYLFPSAFRVHQNLRRLTASNNRFSFFPAELLAALQFLEYVDLSNNTLTNVEELDFARLPRLHTLVLARNKIELIGESAFHNSTQLQTVDLSDNKISRLGERTFEGLSRLELLNLEGNQLSELPESIFERAKLQMLENINLARNQFQIAPLKTLQRQYFFLSSVNLSHNQIQDIPPEDGIMVNIKKLDLSYNPLSSEAVANVLGEPKTVRELHLAGTGITKITTLETPFLKHLNLSDNLITNLPDGTFSRATLLEDLDVSKNKLTELLPHIWPQLKNLQAVDLSDNPIEVISRGDLDGLAKLQRLKIQNLEKCTRFEKDVFKPLENLDHLEAYGYPRLGYLDVHGVLAYLPALTTLDIEVKDAAIGGDQLAPALQARLESLGIRGSRVTSISSGALVGLRGPELSISLRNTSLVSLPPALLFPVPRSTRVKLDVGGSTLGNLSRQLLATLDERRGDVTLLGLETNPLVCDCGVRALRRWLPGAGMAGIKCSAPENLAGKLLVEIGDDELTCDVKKQTSTVPPTVTTKSTTRLPTKKATEPDIIFVAPPTLLSKEKTSSNKVATASVPGLGNDDTLIIGIVGGVVAFIAILIIIICIVRLRISNNQYRGGPLAAGGTIQSPSPVQCTCVKPPMMMAPSYATLPHSHKLMSMPQSTSPSLRQSYATMGRPNYYQTPPYCISYPSEDKSHR